MKFNASSHATGLRVALSTMAILLVVAISPAKAGVVYDADLVSPGVYYGSGNTNGHFVVDNENGVEIGFRAKLYAVGNISPTGNLYQVSTGLYSPSRALWNFDFSVNPGAQSLTGTTALITIKDLLHGTTT